MIFQRLDVSERLGHSTVAMRQDTYAHVLPEMQEAVKVLDGMFTKEVNAQRKNKTS
ncbi:hypothetical protein SPACI_048650 [Sporomusa acidovorans DSM 3132]|uniref:Integrase n=1 Tax=Sporomusa acidovorans (strain ATCC 49682 / DSM 3132 / Mol) TaxID=1123286 RepID=A0ABZ3J8N7_SPOA4|nr:hypothetical protein [Sporomusa acidovorans]OZC16144.1 hypothetical protein SPACI_45110 [Sporomusa acidovorans DSM 3132]SDE29017.1 hypothetical protein SAMN04488499_10119 [Sporomusa acidovorans]